MHNSFLHVLLKNDDFLNTNISQGSVATRLGCGVVFIYIFCLCYKYPTESICEKILKIGQYLVKLWARVRCLVFLTHSVEHSPYCLCRPVIDVICTLVRLVHVSGTVVVSGSCSSLVD